MEMAKKNLHTLRFLIVVMNAKGIVLLPFIFPMKKLNRLPSKMLKTVIYIT